MSFSKAKLQRFNDIAPSTPSPADYNVQLKTNTKNTKMLPESPASSDRSSTSLFRTPTIFKKKKTTTKTDHTDNEALQDKIVECRNKDETIKELLDQVQDMHRQINSSNLSNMQLEDEKKRLIEENRGELQRLLTDIDKCQTLYNATVQEYENKLKTKNDSLEMIGNETKMFVGKFREDIRIFVQTLAEEKRKITGEIQSFQQICSSEIHKLLEEKQKIIDIYETKLKLVEENWQEINRLMEIQSEEKLKEIECNWRLKLEKQGQEKQKILEECQKKTKMNQIKNDQEKDELKSIIQQKQEIINKLQFTLKDLDCNHQNLIIDHKSLQKQMSLIIIEMNDTNKKYGEEKQMHQHEMQQILNEKRMYEKTIANSQKTIDVLKNRLLDSDRDVIQLKEELEMNEKKLLEFEEEINRLQHNLEMAIENNDENENLLASNVASIKMDMDILQNNLMREAEEYKRQLTEKTVEIEKYRLNQKEMEENGNFATENRKNYTELLEQLEHLKMTNKKQEDEIKYQANLIGPFREQLEEYKQKYEKSLEEKTQIENEAKLLDLKLAESFGHQNIRQKIKYMADLKLHNQELKDKLSNSAKIINALKKENANLKKLSKKSNADDKENIGILLDTPKIERTINSPKIESPIGPLRHRN